MESDSLFLILWPFFVDEWELDSCILTISLGNELKATVVHHTCTFYSFVIGVKKNPVCFF